MFVKEKPTYPLLFKGKMSTVGISFCNLFYFHKMFQYIHTKSSKLQTI